MKTVLYFRANEFNFSTHGVAISILATSYNQTTEEKLYQIKSELLDEDQLKQRYDNKVVFVSEEDALELGQDLQPTRMIEDEFTGEQVEFTFTLPDDNEINLAKLKMTDIGYPRGVEDLFEALKTKGVLEDSDAPIVAEKVNDKKAKRDKLK